MRTLSASIAVFWLAIAMGVIFILEMFARYLAAITAAFLG